jgi:hypothetical protein
MDRYDALVLGRHIRTVIKCYETQLLVLSADSVLRPLIANSLEEAKTILERLEVIVKFDS